MLHLLFVAITYGKVRLWLWKSWETPGIFFSYFVATLRYEAQRRLALFVSNTETSFCINANAVADDVQFSLFSTHLLLLLL